MNNIKNWKFVLSIFAITPLLFTLSLFVFYIHFTIELGYYPIYNNPDYKEIIFYNIYEPIILVLGYIWLMSIILWIPLVLMYWIKFKNNTNWKPVVFVMISFIIALSAIFTIIIEWFAE